MDGWMMMMRCGRFCTEPSHPRASTTLKFTYSSATGATGSVMMSNTIDNNNNNYKGSSCRHFWISVVGLFVVTTATALSSSSPYFIISRRSLLFTGGSAVTAGWCCWTTAPESSLAIRGAAELDLEYYAKNLIGGNKREGSVPASPPPPMPPPRQLKDPLASLLLNHDCTVDCLTTLALVEVIHTTQPKGRGPGLDPVLIEKDVKNRVAEIRNKAQRAFYQKAPWQNESIFDQYYFDLTSYALYKTAAALLPEDSLAARDEFVRRTGRFVLNNLQQYRLLIAAKRPEKNLVQSIAGIQEILDLFTKDNICKSYRLGDQPIRGPNKMDGAFLDELDDQTLALGGSVDCLLSVFEPATLNASLQITGEQSRFAPDFIGPTIAAYWESMGVRCTWETYFVDPTYRPNPKDYFPNEQLYQFTLTKVEARIVSGSTRDLLVDLLKHTKVVKQTNDTDPYQ